MPLNNDQKNIIEETGYLKYYGAVCKKKKAFGDDRNGLLNTGKGFCVSHLLV